MTLVILMENVDASVAITVTNAKAIAAAMWMELLMTFVMIMENVDASPATTETSAEKDLT